MIVHDGGGKRVNKRDLKTVERETAERHYKREKNITGKKKGKRTPLLLLHM